MREGCRLGRRTGAVVRHSVGADGVLGVECEMGVYDGLDSNICNASFGSGVARLRGDCEE